MTETWRGRISPRGEGFVLGLLLGGTGLPSKPGTRRRAEDPLDVSLFIEQAKQAEAGKIHTIFLADGLTVSEKAPRPGLEPLTLLSALATHTSRIGLVASVSTSFTEPYNLARQILSLDHISGGRAGWNLVTSSAGERNFGKALAPHDERYAAASEFADVVRALWESWEPDALSRDAEGGLRVAPEKVRRIGWRGPNYAVEGPLNVSRSPQDRPILAQAGSSSAGKALGARVADLIFTTGLTEIEPSIQVARDYKTLAQSHGRSPDAIKILPGVGPILGSTDEEARRQWERLVEGVDYEAGRESLASQFGGVDFGGFDLDAPIPLERLPRTEEVQGRRSRSEAFRRLIESGRVRSIRDLIVYNSFGAGHWFPIGSVENVADQLQERYERGAADGFNILAMTLHYDLGLEAITDHLIPELQRRGIYHRDYAHSTLRGNLGLS